MESSASVAPTAPARPLRVLHMGSPTGLYGAERWILALIKHLPTEQIESFVGVIKDAPDLEAPLCTVASELGFKTHVIESYGKLSRSAVGQLRRVLIDHQIDILHTHGYKTDLIGSLAARGTRCKTLSTPHGWSVNAGIKLQVYEALDRFCFLFMDAVAPLSGELYDGLKSVPGLKRKLYLIENAVDLSEIDAPSTLPEPVQSWRNEQRFIIGYIGQLISRKHVETLIEAFSKLGGDKKRLCIVGEGPQRTAIETLTHSLGEQTRVTLLGFRSDRIALLKGFNVLVLPSELEGIPRCIMEAMGARVPVIASDIPGCQALVDDGETGFLFQVADADTLTLRLREISENATLSKKFALRAREKIEKQFSAALMAKRYAALYQSRSKSARLQA